jgi:hypothetical protein
MGMKQSLDLLFQVHVLTTDLLDKGPPFFR